MSQARTSLVESEDRSRQDAALIAQMRELDALTGLPNWDLLAGRLAATMAAREQDGGEGAVLLLNVDGFRRINDIAGHACGDYFIHAVAARLVRCVGAADMVARRGGDEFCVMLARVAGAEEAATAGARLLAAAAEPLRIRGREYALTASVGASLFPRDAADADALLAHASAALHRAKRDGGNGLCFYSPELQTAMLERHAIESGLRHALARGELALVYQPQVSLRSARIDGVETLLRWRHPELGSVPPARFVPVAEETGHILSIGAWVLAEACRQGRAWHDDGLRHLRLAVNISPRQFRQPDLVSCIEAVLAETGLPGEALELEITEGTLMTEPERAAETMRRLKRLGIRFSLDDFGTGYSSLGYLRHFPLDRLKIDRSFVAGCSRDRRDSAIVEAVCGLAKSLGIETVAEGVETAAQLEFVRQAGCDLVQGYLYSPPLPAGHLVPLLRQCG